MRFFVRSTLTLAAAGAVGCTSSPTETTTAAQRLEGAWVYSSNCRCPAPPVTFIMDLTVEGSSVTGTGTWTAFSPDTVAIAGYIDNDNSVKLEITFPHETVTYFRASVVGNRTLNGTWDDPPADLRPMLFRRLD